MSDTRPILIIDDGSPIRLVLRDFLEMAGHTVIEAGDGVDGVEAAVEHGPRLIICDCNMPRMDGIDTLRAIRSNENTAHIPFVFRTGYVEPERFADMRGLGMSAFLRKPIDFRALQDTVNQALDDVCAEA